MKELAAIIMSLHKLRMSFLYRELQQVELTGPQLFILRELFMQEPRKLSELSKAVQLSNSTVSGIVDRLERDGLIERKRDEEDRRIVWISTTNLCQRMKKDRLESINQELYEGLDNKFTPEQFALCKDILVTFKDHLEKKLEGME
ncbi:MarR family winged helix-turn-helix transcriptional regulator [Paenibacillus hexagrammi]|uniref:MarR family transcriptional regulator n=1 Tax=Paenibacillus hexagrammi TaxID=2908839 RepID=A0ABY3SST8_9BACL|nr:MarR family transcriptional regulator [Paenibacillus sp. YPD9-1]UJF36231.1 MarR family transcriptional regulator [Paenibacillus sp. YPD9-1]